MIKRIIAFGFVICLFISIPLALMGIERVELGGPFLALLKNTSRELNEFKIQIPSIPSIPSLDKVGGIWIVIDVLVQFINGFVNILNFVVTILNIVISLLQYIFLVVKNMIQFKDDLVSAQVL